jgi:hypothetical protein
VKNISPPASYQFQTGFGASLFKTYVESMKLQGIKVTPETEVSGDGNNVK